MNQKYYPLVMTNIAIENGDLQWIFPLKMVIFHSYVSLPEGRAFKWFKYTEIYGKNGNLTRNHWELALF